MTHQSSSFGSEQHYDEAGHTTSVKSPERKAEYKYDYDGRSFMTAEHMGTKATNTYTPDASGALAAYSDPSGQSTSTERDGLGRAIKRTYPDASSEELFYDGPRLQKMRDRQNRWQTFDYDAKGRLHRVLSSGGSQSTGAELDVIEYDEAGRLRSWKTPGVVLQFGAYDTRNRPQQITQQRLDAGGAVLDSFVIGHSWNAAGELQHTTLPATPGGGKWIAALDYHHDGAGNIDTITAGGTTLLSSSFRGAGRPVDRTLTLAGGKSLRRAYTYDDAKGSVGRFDGMSASVAGVVVSGSSIEYDGDTTLRKQIDLLGVSAGTRSTTIGYDERGRVTGASVATTNDKAAPQAGAPAGVAVGLTAADFRNTLTRSGIAPATVTGEAAAGHKIATVTKGSSAETRLYKNADGSEGGVLTEDAKYRYEFDEKGRLATVTEKLVGVKTFLTRVKYVYTGFGRLAGRRVETATVQNNQPPLETAWGLATPSQVIGPLPAAATFVWDPATDQLLGIYAEGSAGTAGAPVRQFISGGIGLDDPILVIAAQNSTTQTRMYPLYDEAGDGSLQAIVGEDGALLVRDLQKDPYGEEAAALPAPVVDKVKIDATKNTDGTLAAVTVSLRTTERLDPATIGNGGRLATVTSSGSVVHTATAQSVPGSDGYSLTWTLTGAQWTALVDPGTETKPLALSIAATSTLRSTTFGVSTPVLPANGEMGANIYSSSALPVEVREPLATITSALTAGGTHTPFELADLAAAGVPVTTLSGDPTNGLTLSPFQAHPFSDPFTGKNYVRARWYDPGTGTWLSPDPVGYGDSSNLYAFAGGDPVNGRDPTGRCLWIFGDKPCGELVREVVKSYEDDMVATTPSTGNKALDKRVRQIQKAPFSAVMKPGEFVMTIGETPGKYLDRMHQAVFQGGPPIGAKEEDLDLAMGTAGDLMMLLAPVEMLEGEFPELRSPRGTKVKVLKPTNPGIYLETEAGGSLRMLASPTPYVEDEVLAAKWYAEQGDQVVLRPGQVRGSGVATEGKKSDLVVNGVTVDVYSPSGSVKTVVREVQRKLSASGQATRVALVPKSSVDLPAVESRLEKTRPSRQD